MRAGPSAKAGRGAGRAGEWRSGPESGLTRKSGPKWAFAGWAERVLGFLGAGLSIFLSYFLFFSFLNLIQTKFEFKFEFEFKPHSNKSMHQHECNKNLNL